MTTKRVAKKRGLARFEVKKSKFTAKKNSPSHGWFCGVCHKTKPNHSASQKCSNCGTSKR